jgi:hypothetical protein
MRQWLTYHTWEYLRRLDMRQLGAELERIGLKGVRVSQLMSCQEASETLVSQIKFPLFKPPALVTLDDRAIQFEGEFPSLDTLRSFKPWNRRSS